MNKADAQKLADELQNDHADAHAASAGSAVVNALSHVDWGKVIQILQYLVQNMPVKK